MFTLVGFSQSQNVATLTNISALADPHVSVSGNNVTISDVTPFLAMTYALGPSVTQATILAPSMQGRIPYNIAPLDVAATPTPTSFFPQFNPAPIPLKAGENLNAQMAVSGGVASRVTVLGWLSSGPIVPDESGNIITVRATATTTLTANAWTNGTLTLDNNLEAGTYDLMGAYGQSAGLQAFRFVFQNQGPRPGAIGSTAVSANQHLIFRRGKMGVWGTFTNLSLPSVDFLSNSADTAETVWLDLRKK